MTISKTFLSLSLVSALALTGLASTASADTINQSILETNPAHLGVEKSNHLSAPVASTLPSKASRLVTETDPSQLGVPARVQVKVGERSNREVDQVTAETDPSVFGVEYSHNHL